MVLQTRDYSGEDDETWVGSGYILKVKAMGFADSLDGRYERKRKVSVISRFLA